MSFFERMFVGLPKPNEVKKDKYKEEELPPFEDGSDSADGDTVSDLPAGVHDLEDVLKENPESRQEDIKSTYDPEMDSFWKETEALVSKIEWIKLEEMTFEEVKSKIDEMNSVVTDGRLWRLPQEAELSSTYTWDYIGPQAINITLEQKTFANGNQPLTWCKQGNNTFLSQGVGFQSFDSFEEEKNKDKKAKLYLVREKVAEIPENN
jgi:hypothetical protein